MNPPERDWISGEESDRAWQATLEGRCEEALRMWDSIVQRTGEATAFDINRGITRLACGDEQGALDGFLVYRNRPNAAKIPVPFVGTALWLQGQRKAACEDWAYETSRRRSGELTHHDEAGGVEVPALLGWASAHADLMQWRKLATDELRDRDRRNRRRKDYGPGPLRRWERWPGVVTPFLLGESPAEAMRPVTNDFSAFMAGKRCKGHFYLGARRLDAGDLDGYRQHLEKAVGQGENSIQEPGYHLARAELVAIG